MAKITFQHHDGSQSIVEVPAGGTVMTAAVANLVPGIVGDCGGACACATCHVIVSSPWLERLEPADELELSMLDIVNERAPGSRLACQIKISEQLDGLQVRTPQSQD